jgi:hypothetical protein
VGRAHCQRERALSKADNPYAKRPLARLYYAGALASVGFMVVACAMYLMHMTTDPSTLPVDERAAFLAIPMWVNAANAVSVWVGLVGAVLLLMVRRRAEPAMLVSLVAAVVWIGGLLITGRVRDAMTENDVVVLIVAGAIIWTIYWFARHSRQRGWLR